MSKTIKVFISQGMSDKSSEEIKAVRQKVKEDTSALLHAEIEVIDSYFEGEAQNNKPVFLLGKAIQKLSEADLVIFVSNCWQMYRGCKIEYEICQQYGIRSLMYTSINYGNRKGTALIEQATYVEI